MSYSPAGRSDFSGDNSLYKQTKLLLNEGDGLPVEPKFALSHEKDFKTKKAKSQYGAETHEGSFGGFNIADIEDFKRQKPRTKSHVPMDDEITNTDTAIDIFGDRSKKNPEEDLPSFGSLVYDAQSQQINRRKSQNVNTLPGMGGFASLGNYSKSTEPEHQNKSKNDPVTISGKYKDKYDDAPAFGAFGGISTKWTEKPSSKPKKQSV